MTAGWGTMDDVVPDTDADVPVWATFDAPLVRLSWGRHEYTVMTVPAELAEAASRVPTRRLEGRLDDVEVNVGINRADVVAQAFVYVGRPLQRAIGAGAGDVVRCVLRPADPHRVPVARDVHEALVAGGVDEAFERLPAPHRRRLLQPVESAATPGTRLQRIEHLVRSLP